MNYGTKLKELRTDMSLTQQDIAEKLGISRSTYKDYELQIKIIPIEYLNNLCNIFEISTDYILNLNSNSNYQNSKENIDGKLSSQRIKELRKEHKITQEKLATLLNTTHSVISDYENNKKIISTPFLYTICKKYNISADYLLGKIDEPKYINEEK